MRSAQGVCYRPNLEHPPEQIEVPVQPQVLEALEHSDETRQAEVDLQGVVLLPQVHEAHHSRFDHRDLRAQRLCVKKSAVKTALQKRLYRNGPTGTHVSVEQWVVGDRLSELVRDAVGHQLDAQLRHNTPMI